MKSKWDWREADKMVATKSLGRMRKAAKVLEEQVEANCPAGTVERPMYKTGPYAGQFWTARDAGQLKRSVRQVEPYDQLFGFTVASDHYANVRVYVGTKKAYYAQIVEYSRPFLRPAVESTRGRVKTVLENG